MRGLITGGCGFVGRRFVKKFTEMGWHVTVVDDLSTGLHPDKWAPVVRLTEEQRGRLLFLRMDARDYFRDPTTEHRYDLVLPLAAVVGGRMTIEREPLRVAT